MKRRFVDAPDSERCKATFHMTGDGPDEKAQCGRHKKIGDFCTQHAKIEANKKKAAA